MFPNLVHHKTQGEAALEVHQFYPLVLTNCSSYLTLFLCSLYAPICTILNRPLPPCRGLCNRVKNGCLPLLQKFGFSWPESMACKKFPERNGLGICVDLATIAAVTTQPPRPTDGKISVNDIWNKWYMNCGKEMKVQKWSSQWTQFMQVRKEAWIKIRALNPWPRDYRCDALPTELWSHWYQVHKIRERETRVTFDGSPFSASYFLGAFYPIYRLSGTDW